MSEANENEDKPNVSPKEAKKMFAEYDRCEKALDQAKVAVDECMAERSVAIEAIHNAMGSGPFEWKGRVLNIRKRGDTYFFVSPSASGVQRID